ncbi:MAG: 2OG-Fe(II) oxygenase [Acidobacteria bacterium]|nr:2OG-Fe(II) oxygenase [Acidobacteriota bacterium]
MDLTYSNRQFAVFDNVLPEREFKLVWNYIQLEDYQFIQQSKWQKVYRLGDGNPLEGATVFSKPIGGVDPSRVKVAPTGTAIDILVKMIQDCSPRFNDWVGEYGKEWEVFSAKPFVYPRGSALSWHHDHAGRTGSYTFYANPHWNVQWGGELLVADESVKDLRRPRLEDYGGGSPKKVGSQFDNEFESGKLMEFGVGQYIFPKPNRLVIIAGGSLHKINPSRAGDDQPRCSISGFFIAKAEQRPQPNAAPITEMQAE